MIKVEEMVVNTNSGKSPRMAAYYGYWEQQIFAALTRMVISSLQTCQTLVSPAPTGEGGAPALPGAALALFRVSAVLSAPEVHVSPPLPDINKLFSKIVKSLVESTRTFVRWMHGTCMETAPQSVNEDEDPVVFSFYPDIASNQEIVGLVSVITRTVAKTFGHVNKRLDTYRKYDQLWKMDKQQHLTKFEQKNPTVVQFDSRLQSYSRVVVDAQAMDKEIDVDFLRIGTSSLLGDIQEHARGWITAIAKLMHSMGRTELIELGASIDEMAQALERDPETLDDLKSVLNLVSEINRRSMEVELQYGALEEWYRTLRMYDFPVPADEAELIDGMAAKWAAICAKAKLTDRSLGRVKKQFTLVTQGQVAEFQQEVAAMYEAFNVCGPGTGIELEAGLEAMSAYTKQLAEMRKTRESLGEALKLFGLPVVAYPELSEVESSLKELQVADAPPRLAPMPSRPPSP